MLAAQAHGDDRGQAAEDQPSASITIHFFCTSAVLRLKGFHGSFFREAALMENRPPVVKLV